MPAKSKTANSTNLVSKKKPTKKNEGYKVSKSFALAYYKMAPSKELRRLIDKLTMSTDLIGNRMAFTQLDGISQGTQLNQRLKNAVRLNYLHLQGSIQNNDTKTKYLRLMVIRELNNGGLNTSTYANLYSGLGTLKYAPSGDQQDGRVQINRDKFMKVWQRIYKVPPETESNVIIQDKIKLGLFCRYPSTDTTSSAVVHGATYLIANLYEGDNDKNTVTSILNIQCRVFFKDANFQR